MPKFDIFRAERRAGGHVDHIGAIEAPDKATAQSWAEQQEECSPLQMIWVDIAEDDE